MSIIIWRTFTIEYRFWVTINDNIMALFIRNKTTYFKESISLSATLFLLKSLYVSIPCAMPLMKQDEF